MKIARNPALQRYWHPVAPYSRFDEKPIGVMLLGVRLCLWKQPDGSIACVIDRCCHEGARMSAGYLENNAIVCPFHEWVFGPDGRCVRIPGSPDPDVANKVAIEAFPVAVKHGCVWVALDEPQAPIPDFGDAILDVSEEVDANAFELLERSVSTLSAGEENPLAVRASWEAPFLLNASLSSGAAVSALASYASPITETKSAVFEWRIGLSNRPLRLLGDPDAPRNDIGRSMRAAIERQIEGG